MTRRPSRSDGDGEVGRLDAAGTPGRGGPLVLLWSADLDASLTAVVGAGGTVVSGRYASPAAGAPTSPTRAATSSASGAPDLAAIRAG